MLRGRKKMLLRNGSVFLSWRMTKLNLANPRLLSFSVNAQCSSEWHIKAITFKALPLSDILVLLLCSCGHKGRRPNVLDHHTTVTVWQCSTLCFMLWFNFVPFPFPGNWGQSHWSESSADTHTEWRLAAQTGGTVLGLRRVLWLSAQFRNSSEMWTLPIVPDIQGYL